MLDDISMFTCAPGVPVPWYVMVWPGVTEITC
jgi:hypothetical protein